LVFLGEPLDSGAAWFSTKWLRWWRKRLPGGLHLGLNRWLGGAPPLQFLLQFLADARFLPIFPAVAQSDEK